MAEFLKFRSVARSCKLNGEYFFDRNIKIMAMKEPNSNGNKDKETGKRMVRKSFELRAKGNNDFNKKSR